MGWDGGWRPPPNLYGLMPIRRVTPAVAAAATGVAESKGPGEMGKLFAQAINKTTKVGIY